MSYLPKCLVPATVLAILPSLVQAVQFCHSGLPAAESALRFIDHGNGTVTDIATELVWKQCVVGRSGPDCAEVAAALGAHHADEVVYDWRLPTKQELTSLVELRCYHPAINQRYFPNTPAGSTFTSSPHAWGGNWYINFSTGEVTSASSASSRSYVRMVRNMDADIEPPPQPEPEPDAYPDSGYHDPSDDLSEVERILRAATTDFSLYSSQHLEINAPDIAENGAVVPVTVSFISEEVSDPGPGVLWLVAPNNPDPILATFRIPASADMFASTRVKLADVESSVVAVYSADEGGLYAARKPIRVTIIGS